MKLNTNLRDWKGMVSTFFALSTAGLLLSGSAIFSGTGEAQNSAELAENDALIENVTFDKPQAVKAAEGDTIVVKSTGTDLSYDITEIRAKAGATITIRYENTSNMPHNIVFVKERSDIQPVGVAALQARDNDYIPQDESLQERMIGYTALAKPGDTVDVTFTVPPPGTYPYICTYPGHFTMMQGDLISEE